MTEATDTAVYAPGKPIWVDLASSDLEGTKRFYSALFGWEAYTVPDPDAGGYGFFLQDGKRVAGFGPTMAPGQPTAWSTYIGTDDADATAARVREAGGQVIAEPFDVFEEGRMAVFTDPTGAFISVWQPRAMRGAELFNQPVSLSWNELATRDMNAAKAFYTHVFGWGTHDSPFGDGGTYTEWQLDGRSIGGGYDMSGMMPESVPPHWLSYFAVENVDSTAARAQELGATVQVPPTDLPGMGRFAVLSDPQGGAFAVFGAVQ